MSEGPIVVGSDGSPDAQRAVDWALTWAREVDAPVSVVVAEPVPPGRKPDADGLGEKARAVLAQELERISAAFPDVEIDGRVEIHHPVTALVAASKEARAVVVGTRGTGGWRGTLVGSVSGNVAASAHAPTVVVPTRASASFDPHGRVVVGLDGSDASRSAAALAVSAAATEGRAVRLVQADVGGTSPAEPLEDVVAELCTAHPGAEVELVTVEGDAAEALTAQSQEAGLLVVASQGHRGVPGFLLGSTTRALVQSAMCPVVVLTAQSKRLWPVVG